MFLNGKLVRPKFGQNFSSEFLNYAVYTEFVANVGILRKKQKQLFYSFPAAGGAAREDWTKLETSTRADNLNKDVRCPVAPNVLCI